MSVVDSKPREERDYKEFYPDLDHEAQLPFFETTRTSDPIPAPRPHDLKAASFRVVPSEPHTGKFGRVLLLLGFDDHRPTQASPTNLRPFTIPPDVKIEDVIDVKKRQVEYDHDEQDELWLEEQNHDKIAIISPEMFEILITQLETDWDQLEVAMSTVSGGEEKAELTLRSNTEKYGDDDGIVQGSVYDQRCAVCNDSDCTNANAIVFCDGCDIAVHQECYGVAFIPEGEWLCRKCMLSRNHPVDCVFCPSKTGAFKQLDNSLWSHVTCALWIPEVYFANPIYMEPIEGIALVPKNRWKLTCYICKQKVGACIQCGNKNCFQAYHVTCAKRAGLHMELMYGVQGGIQNRSSMISYCDRHGAVDASVVRAGIEKTRRYYRDMKVLRAHNAQAAKTQQAANRMNLFRWKTDAGTPIAPQLFTDRVYKTIMELQGATPDRGPLRGLGFEASSAQAEAEIRQFSHDICKYWCLKRERKKGAPLIRKNNNLMLTLSIIYGSNSPEEVGDKLEFAAVLLQDLDRVIQLLGLTVERQKTAEQIAHLNLDVRGGTTFPLQAVLAEVLAKAASAGKTSLTTEIENRNKNYKYETVDSFWNDIQQHLPQLHKSRGGRKWYDVIYGQLERLRSAETSIKNELVRGKIDLPFARFEHGEYVLRPDMGLMDELSDVEEMDVEGEKTLREFLQ